MASAAKTTVSTPGSNVFLAFAIHFYAWLLGSFVLVLANAIHLFLPPWCVIPIAGWGMGLGIHAVVTYFIVDKMGGNFKMLIDQYILKLVPKPIMDQVEAKMK